MFLHFLPYMEFSYLGKRRGVIVSQNDDKYIAGWDLFSLPELYPFSKKKVPFLSQLERELYDITFKMRKYQMDMEEELVPYEKMVSNTWKYISSLMMGKYKNIFRKFSKEKIKGDIKDFTSMKNG